TIVTTGAGLNHLDLPECHHRGIKTANVGDVFSADGADYASGLLIDVLRRISDIDRYVKDGFWSPKGTIVHNFDLPPLNRRLFFIAVHQI
ncbi:Glyoxylate/hydroxypyruvate reductase HPR3, partial [Linum perenne]